MANVRELGHLMRPSSEKARAEVFAQHEMALLEGKEMPEKFLEKVRDLQRLYPAQGVHAKAALYREFAEMLESRAAVLLEKCLTDEALSGIQPHLAAPLLGLLLEKGRVFRGDAANVTETRSNGLLVSLRERISNIVAVQKEMSSRVVEAEVISKSADA